MSSAPAGSAPKLVVTQLEAQAIPKGCHPERSEGSDLAPYPASMARSSNGRGSGQQDGHDKLTHYPEVRFIVPLQPPPSYCAAAG